MVLCAVALGTLCISHRSGTGERKLLERSYINSAFDNAYAGRNLQDHIMAAEPSKLEDAIDIANEFRDPAYVGAATRQYQEK